MNNSKAKAANSPVSSPISKSPRVGVGNKSPFFGGDNSGTLVIKSPRGGNQKELELFKEEKIDRENQANSSIKKVIFLNLQKYIFLKSIESNNIKLRQYSFKNERKRKSKRCLIYS